MVAQLQSPNQQSSYQNRAPLKPLTELKRGGKKPSSYIQKAIQQLFAHFHRKDRDTFREIFNVGQLINLFVNGCQYPVRNPTDGSWGMLPLGNRNSDQRVFNIMQNIKMSLLGKWEGSSPDIIIRPGRNLDTCVSAAKAADTINNYYERQFYDHWFTQQEGLMGMTFGTYIDRYRYDENKHSMSVVQEVFETTDTQFGQGFGYCADCEHMGNSSEFTPTLGGAGPFSRTTCPRCHSTAVEVLDAPTGQLSSVAKQENKQLGDLVCELLPLPACRWDLARRPEDSNWFIYRQQIPKGAVTRVLGNVLLPADASDRDTGLDILRALGHQGQPISGSSPYSNQRRGDSNDLKDETVTFDEMWLSPDEYADVQLIGDEETLEGPPLPKGKLTDVFPDGLCAVGLNGMSVVLALYPERHKSHLVSGTWFMQTATGAGRGIADVVESQKQFNTGNNQAVQYMTSTYTPAIGYDNSIWSGSKVKYIGNPRTNIPFDLTKLPEGRKLHDSIYQFQPTAIPGQFFNYFQDFLGYLMKKQSGATDYSQGEPGISPTNPTATAAEIDQGNADAFNEPIFLIKGDCRMRGAKLTIELFRQHFPMKRYFDLGGKYGEQQGIELSGADLDADLSYELDKASVLPKGPYTRRKNLMSFYGIIGGAEGVAVMEQTNPRLLNNTAQEFDVDIEINDFDAVAELCRRRLEQMKEALKLGVTDPSLLITEAIQPPISAKELDLGAKGKWFASWLSTDEGLNSPMPLRMAAELLVDGFIQGQTGQDAELALQQGTVAAAAQAPAAMGAAALEQEGGEDTTQPDATAVLQAEQDITTQQMEAQESEKQRAHEKEMLAAEGRRDKDVAQHDATQKIRIEKAKPKPKVVKPAGKGAKK